MVGAIGAGQYPYNIAESVNGLQEKAELQTQKLDQETDQQIQKQQQIQQQQQQQQIATMTGLGMQLDMQG